MLVVEETDEETGWVLGDGLFAFDGESVKFVKVDERLGKRGIYHHADVKGVHAKVSLQFGNLLSEVRASRIAEYHISGNVKPIGRTVSQF
jgi:hypothetical protein